KLSRGLNHVDVRGGVLVPQIVFYQCGVGSSPNFYSEYIQGKSLYPGEKVQEAYAFIAQNYSPGDEIFLFGFSRGAYTARMVAMFIGAIGVLDKTDMDHFAEIFVTYQKLGKSTNPTESAELKKQIEPWTSPTSRGRQRASCDNNTFSVKCIGVFDTVGSVGLPEEIAHRSPSTKSIFGFPNTQLGDHIERAYQALAINETRVDFDCAKLEQTEGGRKKGQILKQCWFAGSHSDIGGGWHDHDLSDLTLTWMTANIGDMLSVDLKYIASLPDPVAPWGKQYPHDPSTGIFVLAEKHVRCLPTRTDDITHETIHPSVLDQVRLVPQLAQTIRENPSLVCRLLPLEEEVQKSWPYVPKKGNLFESEGVPQIDTPTTTPMWDMARDVANIFAKFEEGIYKQVGAAAKADSKQGASDGLLIRLIHESNSGAILKAYAQVNDKL
ncbi:hypothetical protein J3A83DRAFT_4093964, partial [Scleroderma citrinum]